MCMTSIYPPQPNQRTTGNQEKAESNSKKGFDFVNRCGKSTVGFLYILGGFWILGIHGAELSERQEAKALDLTTSCSPSPEAHLRLRKKTRS
jgi:hypothetical protein